MKIKIVSLLIAIFTIFSLCACDEKGENISGITHTQCTFSDWETITEPTCATNGLKKRVCSVCHKEETQNIEKTEHNYSEAVTKKATCNEAGIKTVYCINCGHKYTREYELQVYAPEEIYNIARKSAVEIITYDKNDNELALGSGFVLSSDGKIVTNYHVIESACSAIATVSDSTYPIVSVLAYDPFIDIAVLKINATNLATLDVCAKPVKVGEPAYALGSSKGLTNTFSQGIITASSREIDGVTYVQHDAAISSGNSGGMLLNKYCEIIGINTWTVRDSQNLNFAIFTSELDNLTYGIPMTLREVYELQCNAFEKVKNYAMEKGSLNSEGDEYLKVLGTDYSAEGTKISRALFYKPSTDIITIAIRWGSDYFLTIELDEVYYSYDWAMLDYSTGFYMKGILYADSFSRNTTLAYSYTNISSSTLKSSFRKFASSLASLLITYINVDLKEINVTAHDLDFLNY